MTRMADHVGRIVVDSALSSLVLVKLRAEGNDKWAWELASAEAQRPAGAAASMVYLAGLAGHLPRAGLDEAIAELRLHRQRGTQPW